MSTCRHCNKPITTEEDDRNRWSHITKKYGVFYGCDNTDWSKMKKYAEPVPEGYLGVREEKRA